MSSPQPTPTISQHMRTLQLASAAALAGTPTAAARASKAGRSVTPAAAKVRSAKALAARWGKPAA